MPQHQHRDGTERPTNDTNFYILLASFSITAPTLQTRPLSNQQHTLRSSSSSSRLASFPTLFNTYPSPDSMAFNNFWRTFFAIVLTAFIFSLLVTILCLIRYRERRQTRQEEEDAPVVLPPPAAEEIEMPQMGNNNEFRHSDETLVEPPVSTEE